MDKKERPEPRARAPAQHNTRRGNIHPDIEKYYTKKYPIIKVNNKKEPSVNEGDTWQRDFDLSEFEGVSNVGIRIGIEIPGQGFLVCIDSDGNPNPDLPWTEQDENIDREFEKHLESLGIPADTLTVRSGGKGGKHRYYRVTVNPNNGGGLYNLQAKKNPARKSTKTGKCWTVPNFQGTCIEVFVHGRQMVTPPSKAKTEYQVIHPAGAEFDVKHARVVDSALIHKLIDSLQPSPSPLLHSPKGRHSENVFTNNTNILFRKAGGVEANDTVHICVIGREKQIGLPDGVEIPGKMPVLDDVRDIWKTRKVWALMIRLASEQLYGVPQAVYRKQTARGVCTNRFNCVLHPESNPSVQLIKNSAGEWRYHEYHGRSENAGKYNMSIQEVFAILRTGDESIISADKRDPEFHSYWTRQMVHYFDLWTREAIDTRQWWDGFKPRIDYLPDDLILTANTIIYEGVKHLRYGHGEFIASKRHISGQLDKINEYNTNKFTNMLVTLDMIKKTDRYKKLRRGETPYFTINVTADIETIKQRWEVMTETGIDKPYKFNKPSVARVFGRDMANYVFRRSARD